MGLPCGLVLYVAGIRLLWQASGRPASIEPVLGKRLLATMASMLQQLFPGLS